MSKLKLTFADSIKMAIDESMHKDKNIILFGEGVDDPSSMFGTIKGLAKKYGSKRAIEMPLSENCLIGAAIGSSMMGDKIIVNLQRVEFALLALEQIINNAAKIHYISQGKHKVAVVIRLIIGRGWGQGPEHSQSLETLFSSIPGLKVMMPVFPNEAYEMMKLAILDQNPIIFLEQRWCHYIYGNVNKKINKKIECFSKLNNGDDLTLVSSGYASVEALKIVNFLKKYDIKVDLYNLKTLRPLNLNKIIKSIQKSKNFISIDNGPKTLGLGAEMLSQIFEKSIKLKSAPIRMGLPDHPVPSSRSFVEEVYVTPKKIFYSIFKSLRISKQKSNKIFSEYKKNIKSLPKDIPHPDFQGPF